MLKSLISIDLFSYLKAKIVFIIRKISRPFSNSISFFNCSSNKTKKSFTWLWKRLSFGTWAAEVVDTTSSAVLGFGTFHYFSQKYGRILKANLGWSRTRAKFCQLIVSLSVILFKLNMTKLKLEFQNSDFKCNKKEKYKHRRKFYCITQARLIKFKLAFRIRPRFLNCEKSKRANQLNFKMQADTWR